MNKSKKRITINFIANIVSYAVSLGISFLLTPYLISQVGKAAYSFYPIANTFLNYIVILTNSMCSIATRFVAINLARNNKKEAKTYFNTALIIESIFGLVLIIPSIILVAFVDKFLDVPFEALLAVRVLFASVFASGIVNVISNVFGAATFSTNRIDLRSYRELGASILRAILCVVAYVFFPASIAYIGIVALFIAIFNLIVQLIYTKKLLPGFFPNRERPTKKHIKEIMVSSVWTIIISFGNMFLSGMTIVLSNVFYGSDISGTISIVLTIPGFLSGIVTLIVGIFYPLITDSVANNNKEELQKTIMTVIKICGGFCVAVISVFLAVSTQFFQLWVPTENSSLLFLLSALFLAPYVTTSAFWVFNNLFIAKNQVRVPAILTICFGTGNVGIFCILSVCNVPYYIPIIVTVLLEIVLIGVLFPLYGSKISNMPIRKCYYIFLNILFSGFFVFALCFALANIVVINSWLKFVLFGVLFGFIGLNVIFAFQDFNFYLLSIKFVYYRIKTIFKKKKGTSNER